MDVTSMLNNSTADGSGQQKTSRFSNTAPKERTPWDAGGYALPIITHPSPKGSQHRDAPIGLSEDCQDFSRRSLQPESIDSVLDDNRHTQRNNIDSTLDSSRYVRDEISPLDDTPEAIRYRPNEAFSTPRHHFSDSRSSLSSFASSLSLNSATHSRLSSTSTVGGYHPMSTINDDADLDNKRNCVQHLNGKASPLIYSPVGIHPRSHSTASTTEPLSTLALIAERKSLEDLNADTKAHNTAKRSQMELARQTGKTPSFNFKSSSPSDPLMIKRANLQPLQAPKPTRDRKRRL